MTVPIRPSSRSCSTSGAHARSLGFQTHAAVLAPSHTVNIASTNSHARLRSMHTFVRTCIRTRTHKPATVYASKRTFPSCEHATHRSLRDLLRNPGVPVDWELALQLAQDVAQGMRYLHGWTPPIVHAGRFRETRPCLLSPSPPSPLSLLVPSCLSLPPSLPPSLPACLLPSLPPSLTHSLTHSLPLMNKCAHNVELDLTNQFSDMSLAP